MAGYLNSPQQPSTPVPSDQINTNDPSEVNVAVQQKLAQLPPQDQQVALQHIYAAQMMQSGAQPPQAPTPPQADSQQSPKLSNWGPSPFSSQTPGYSSAMQQIAAQDSNPTLLQPLNSANKSNKDGTVTLPNGLVISRPTAGALNDAQTEYMKSQNFLAQLDNLAKGINWNYFSGPTQAHVGLLEKENKWVDPIYHAVTGNDFTSDEDKSEIQTYTAQYHNIEQQFQIYRKEMAGTRSNINELNLLRKGFLTTDASPEEAKGALGQAMTLMTITGSVYQSMLRDGIVLPPGTNDPATIQAYEQEFEQRQKLMGTDASQFVQQYLKDNPGKNYTDGVMEWRKERQAQGMF